MWFAKKITFAKHPIFMYYKIITPWTLTIPRGIRCLLKMHKYPFFYINSNICFYIFSISSVILWKCRFNIFWNEEHIFFKVFRETFLSNRIVQISKQWFQVFKKKTKNASWYCPVWQYILPKVSLSVSYWIREILKYIYFVLINVYP